MILDDEADYASQNTDIEGEGSTIHEDLINLRKSIPRNCYVAYTATPQACLSADPEDPIGYPRDFWWLIEPFMVENDGQRVPKTYLGLGKHFGSKMNSCYTKFLTNNGHITKRTDSEGQWVFIFHQ